MNSIYGGSLTHFPPAQPDRDDRRSSTTRILAILIGVVLVAIIAGIIAFGVLRHGKPSAPTWTVPPGTTSPTPSPAMAAPSPTMTDREAIAKLTALREKVRDLDDLINRLDARALATPHDDDPINDMGEATTSCVRDQSQYDELSYIYPHAIDKGDLPEHLDGDQQTDCAVDMAGPSAPASTT